MKKAKRNAILTLIIFVLLTAGAVYAVVYGIGEGDARSGRAKDITLGLDLQGGVSITYQIMDPDATSEQIAATKDKLQRRVDHYSPDGEVYREGDDRLTVEIPVDTSKYDPNEILEELGKPGKLEFMDETNYQLWASGEDYEPVLTGSDIKDAQAGIRTDDTTGQNDNEVQLQFTDEGAQKFAVATSANVGKPIYIIFDDEVVSYPTVQTAITDGNAVINSIGTYEEAENLASTIKIGALPLELSELRSQVLGAKLGNEAVATSLKAGAIGIILVCLIMIIFYRFPGFISSIALFVYIVLEMFLINVLKITLTLPGIAGIILSIGMAVDANVIIFTRIREEIGDGKTVKIAVKAGFSKALSAILDGNITTVIAGVVLLVMGSGTVKGFARTLILGIILSMFTALVITRLLLNSFVALGVINKKLYGAAKKPKVAGYSKAFKYCATASVIVILAGIIFLPINKANKGTTMNFSLEFMGGTSTSVTFDKAYTLQETEADIIPVIEEATGVNPGTVQIQIVDNSNQIVFKTAELNQTQREALSDALNEKFTVTEINSENISSTISSEMQRDAIIAIIISSILMLIYIAIRFSDVRFGTSAVLALIHDVMFVFMVYSVAWLSVGSTFIACMLTILGYSINATIIVFDRIRENLRLMSVDRDGYDKIVDTSISQTLTRNIFTSLTTFVMVLVLYIMGVSSIKEFTLTLMAGIICGAYSSVCISGPLWLALKKIGKKKEKAKAKA